MKIKFNEAYQDYLIYIDNRLKIQSKNSLKQRFEKIIIPYFGDKYIDKITKVEYIKFQNILQDRNYSYNYSRNIHFLLVGFFNFCIKYYELNENIFKLVGPLKVKITINKKKYYSQIEFHKFIKNVDKGIYKDFFLFMYLTGCRPGEAMALKFKNYKHGLFNGKVLIKDTIDEHHSKDTGKREINSPKSKTSERTITIPFILNYKLNKLLKKYKNDLSYKNYFVFGGLTPLAPTTINRYKLKSCIKSNLEPISLHGFRHSHATLLLDKKVSIKVISERLGHSDTAITLNTYIHSTDRQEKRVLRTLNFIRLSF